MRDKVEIIKIGSIIKDIKANSIVDTIKYIMLVEESDDDPNTSYYLSILRDYCTSKEIPTMNSRGIIRSTGTDSYQFRWSDKKSKHMSGFSDGDPIVGQAFTIDHSSWHTSKVVELIGSSIILTKNSVYAIHNKSVVRNDKLKDLGIE